jgi:hypothetical protein
MSDSNLRYGKQTFSRTLSRESGESMENRDYHRYWKPVGLNVSLAGVGYGLDIHTPAKTHTCGLGTIDMMGF